MPFRVLVLLALFYVSLISNPLHAQSISGSVRDTGGNPLGGAVQLYDAAGNYVENFWLDPDGNFQTWPLDNGAYFAVTAFTHEMLDEAWNNVPCENLLCMIQASTPIAITGSDVTGIDFVLEPILVGGHISGLVEDGSHTPLPGVGIDVRNANGDFLFGIGTGQDGRFQTPLLADDSYYVHTVREPYGLGRKVYDNFPCQPPDICGDPGFVTDNGTAIVVSGVDAEGIDFMLEVPAGAIISGQLTDADTGIVLPDVHMNLLNEFNQYTANTNSDESGNYYFSGLADGTYKVYAVEVPEGYEGELYGGDHCDKWDCDLDSVGTPIVISGGASDPGKDIVLDFSGTRLLGTVTRSDTGLPVTNEYAWMVVDLFNQAGDYMGGWPANRAGQFQIILPGAGDYYLVATNDWDRHGLINEAWDDIKCQWDCNPVNVGATLIPVAEGTTVVADFVLDPGLHVSGTIRIEGTPTEQGFVKIWNAAGQLVQEGWNDGNGNWSSDQLPPGTYYASVRGEDFGVVSQLYSGIACPQEFCDVTGGTPIVLSDSDLTDINFDLAPFSADWMISGTVRNSEGYPVGGGVRIFDPFGSPFADFGNDPEGNFQTFPLPNGTYFMMTVNTWELLDEAWDNVPCENMLCDITTATPIVVDGAHVSGIDFELEPIVVGGHIAGTIKDSGDMPLPHVFINVQNVNGDFLLGAQTNPDGSYQTQLLADGTYYIHTENEPVGLGRELYDNYPCQPANICGDPNFITSNGTPIVIGGADATGKDFTLEVPTGAIISGQLTDADTGFVLPDVSMTLLNEFNQYVANTNTDGLGNYYFSGLSDGTYKVYAVGVPEGYSGEFYGGDQCHEWNCDLNSVGTLIVISGGAPVPDKNIVLDYSGTRLFGRITRSDNGAPVSSWYAHAGMDVFNEAGERMYGWGTDLAGQIQLPLPGAGNYYLVASNDWNYHHLVNEAWDDIKCYYDCNPIGLGANLIPVAEGATVIAEFVLDPGFELSGAVKVDGAFSGGALVKIWDESGQLVLSVWNDGDGNWRTPPLPAGTYYATVRGEVFGMVSQLYNGIACPQEFCDVTTGTPIVVADAAITDINFDLAPLSADWTISGSIRDAAGNPVGGSVRFHDPFGNLLFQQPVDEAGNFQTPPVADGSYFAITRGTGDMLDEAWGDIPCENRICDITGSTPIIVSGSNVTGIDFVLDPILVGGHIIGRVTDSDSNPLADVGLIFRNSEGGWLYHRVTGPDGFYQSPLLANDTYFLHTRDEPFGLGQELYDDIPCQPHGGCGDVEYIVSAGSPVVIDGGNATGIDFSLEVPPGGLISGQVTDFDTGMPLPDVHMVLIDEFHNQVEGTFTDPLGDYYFSALEDRDYKVYAERVPEGYTQELFGGDHCPDWSCDLNTAGTAIGISGGAWVDGKDIVLDYEGTRLLGTIKRSDTGAPVSSQYAHAGADLFNAAGEYMGTWGTNRAGQYQITLPGAGDYYLAATVDWDFHQLINELWDDIRCYDNCNPLDHGAALIPVEEGATVVADFMLDPEVIFRDGYE